MSIFSYICFPFPICVGINPIRAECKLQFQFWTCRSWCEWQRPFSVWSCHNCESDLFKPVAKTFYRSKALHVQCDRDNFSTPADWKWSRSVIYRVGNWCKKKWPGKPDLSEQSLHHCWMSTCALASNLSSFAEKGFLGIKPMKALHFLPLGRGHERAGLAGQVAWIHVVTGHPPQRAQITILELIN